MVTEAGGTLQMVDGQAAECFVEGTPMLVDDADEAVEFIDVVEAIEDADVPVKRDGAEAVHGESGKLLPDEDGRL